MNIHENYLKNSETVEKIGEMFGFVLHSFDPNWCIYYKGGYGVHEVSDLFIEHVARMMGLPWVNEYELTICTTVLDKASKERNDERNAENIAVLVAVWVGCKFNTLKLGRG
jgi:hypothetical protein